MGPPSYICGTLLTETLLDGARLFTHTHTHTHTHMHANMQLNSQHLYIHTFAWAFLSPHIKQFIPYCIMDNNKYSYRNSSRHFVKIQNRM